MLLLRDTFKVVQSGSYKGSPVQLGFQRMFDEADKDGDGFVEKGEFPILMQGYFNSKHLQASREDYEQYFKKINLNRNGRISFEEFDIFVRGVYQTEYLPQLEREVLMRGLDRADAH